MLYFTCPEGFGKLILVYFTCLEGSGRLVLLYFMCVEGSGRSIWLYFTYVSLLPGQKTCKHQQIPCLKLRNVKKYIEKHARELNHM